MVLTLLYCFFVEAKMNAIQESNEPQAIYSYNLNLLLLRGKLNRRNKFRNDSSTILIYRIHALCFLVFNWGNISMEIAFSIRTQIN